LLLCLQIRHQLGSIIKSNSKTDYIIAVKTDFGNVHLYEQVFEQKHFPSIMRTDQVVLWKADSKVPDKNARAVDVEVVVSMCISSTGML
jgi:hypothetical protein